jgi:hypothetical protein
MVLVQQLEQVAEFGGKREHAALSVLRGARVESDFAGLHVDLAPL